MLIRSYKRRVLFIFCPFARHTIFNIISLLTTNRGTRDTLSGSTTDHVDKMAASIRRSPAVKAISWASFITLETKYRFHERKIMNIGTWKRKMYREIWDHHNMKQADKNHTLWVSRIPLLAWWPIWNQGSLHKHTKNKRHRSNKQFWIEGRNK